MPQAVPFFTITITVSAKYATLATVLAAAWNARLIDFALGSLAYRDAGEIWHAINA